MSNNAGPAQKTDMEGDTCVFQAMISLNNWRRRQDSIRRVVSVTVGFQSIIVVTWDIDSHRYRRRATCSFSIRTRRGHSFVCSTCQHPAACSATATAFGRRARKSVPTVPIPSDRDNAKPLGVTTSRLPTPHGTPFPASRLGCPRRCRRLKTMAGDYAACYSHVD